MTIGAGGWDRSAFNRKSFAVLALIPLAIFAAACTAEQRSERNESLAEEHHEDAHEEGHAEGVIETDPDSGELAGLQITDSRQRLFREYLETTGVVSVNEGKVVHVRPLSKGIVQEVFVLPGDDVISRQPLVRYDNIEMSDLLAEYQSRKAELRQATADLGVTRKLWERGRELLDAQAISEKDLDLRYAEYQRAREMANISQVEIRKIAARLRRYGLSEEELDSEGEKGQDDSAIHTKVRSPFAGTIIGFNVAEGEIIAPERVLMTIADLSTVWVFADIYEKDLGQIERKGEVEVVMQAYPDLIFRGRITYLGDSVDPQTRTIKIRAELPNADRKLKLGMYGRVRILLNAQRELPAVPNSALQKIGDDEVVFVQLAPHRFEPRVVRSGPKEGEWIAIEAGLAAGEEIVGKGSFSLKSELLKERLGGGHAH